MFWLSVGGFAAEDGDDVFDWDDEEAVVAFEVDGHRVLGVEEDAVVAFDGVVEVFFDFGGDGEDAAGQGRDFDLVGQVDAGFGLLFVIVLAEEDSLAERLDDFEATAGLFGIGLTH